MIEISGAPVLAEPRAAYVARSAVCCDGRRGPRRALLRCARLVLAVVLRRPLVRWAGARGRAHTPQNLRDVAAVDLVAPVVIRAHTEEPTDEGDHLFAYFLLSDARLGGRPA